MVLASAIATGVFHGLEFEAAVLCCIALVPIAYCYGWRGFIMTAAWIVVLAGTIFMAVVYSSAVVLLILRQALYNWS